MVGTLLGMGTLISAFCYYQNNSIDISRFTIDLNVKNKIKILQLSDLHGKMFGKDNKKLIEVIKEECPDIIVATGDLIDSRLNNMDKVINFLSKINEFRTVIYIPGNNEARTTKYNYILESLKSKKVTVLENEIITLSIDKTLVNILGLVEKKSVFTETKIKMNTFKDKSEEIIKLLEEFERKEGIKIILSHYPENFSLREENSYENYNIDVMFAGHAHGGQFILPILGGLFAPGQGILPKYYEGIHGEKNKLIISRGLGNSGFPLRLFNKPNIVMVDLI